MLKIDLHIHTVASADGHSTVLEYINQAKKLKMKIIGISDHGPGSKESIVPEVHFQTLYRIPEFINGIRVLKGVEANIINKKGNIDVSEYTIKKLDYVSANFHSETPYKNLGIKGNTETVINAIKSKKIKILTHPFWMKTYKVDIKKISEAACLHNVLLEINMHYFRDHKIMPDTLANVKTMVDVVKRLKMKVIVGTDSHTIWQLGDDANLLKYKKQIGLTDEMIINNCPKELLNCLNIKK